MKQLERMIFPQDYKGATENLLWKVKNDGSLPVVKALKKTQISCQYLNGDVSNRWCPANPMMILLVTVTCAWITRPSMGAIYSAGYWFRNGEMQNQ